MWMTEDEGEFCELGTSSCKSWNRKQSVTALIVIPQNAGSLTGWITPQNQGDCQPLNF